MRRRQRMEDWYNVVVNFLSLVIFVFLLFLGMLMYANEVDTKEKEKLLKMKINYNLYNTSAEVTRSWKLLVDWWLFVSKTWSPTITSFTVYNFFLPFLFFSLRIFTLVFCHENVKKSKIDHNQLSQNIFYISIYTINIIVVSRQLVFSVSGAKKPAKLSYFIVKGPLIISVPFKWVLHTYLVSVQAKQGTSLVFGRIKGRATHLSPSSVGCWAHLK